MPGSCVVIQSHNNGVHGTIMYPGDRGVWESDEDRKAYCALFKGKAPFLPYAEVGRNYGERKCSEEEVHAACVEHMENKFSLPKDLTTFWEADELAQKKLNFPIAIVREKAEAGEDPKTTAIRGLWEETGMRVDPGELILWKVVKSSHVYYLKVSFQRAKDAWIVHQAERLTLTDWGRCPHSGVLDYLGVPRAVKSAYCETHGGPIFVKNLEEHNVEEITLSILKN